MNEIGKSEFNPIIVSVLFLKWKTDLSSQDIDVLNSSVFHKGKIVLIDKFPNEVKLALILLGAFFRFRKFYDNYYEALNLRFCKDFKPQKQIEKEEPQEKVDMILETDNSVKTVTEEEQVKDENQEVTSNITSQYKKIIEDELDRQPEVKLTEIKRKIKKLLHETKAVDEIKKLIIDLPIEVESVKGKTRVC
jgi:hypothetical protein